MAIMRLIIFLTIALAANFIVVSSEGQQLRTIRRVIKSTPTATNLGRIRQVTVRSAELGEKPDVISQTNAAASFGQRSLNDITTTKTEPSSSAAKSPTATSTSSTTTTSSASTPSPSTDAAQPRTSGRQQTAPTQVEVTAISPSSWQMLTAIEAPAAALITSGTRPAAQSSDLSSSSSEGSSSFLVQNDFLRASPSDTKGSFVSVGETSSRLHQQTGETSTRQQKQQSFFYPQQQRQGKTNYQVTKTSWYQPTSTTPSPAPIVQEQHYEQQNEQYVEQQQVDSAPPGQAEPFAFDFNTQDNSGNGQYRKEESDNNGVVRGSYGFRDASGIYRHVEYFADQNGFRANIKSNEPGVEGGPDSQPASIRLDGPAPAQTQRATNNDNVDWSGGSSSNNERADLAFAPPNFESSHISERITP